MKTVNQKGSKWSWHNDPDLTAEALPRGSKLGPVSFIKMRGVFCTKEQRCCSLSIFIQFFPDFNTKKHFKFQSLDPVAAMRASVDWQGLGVAYLNPTAAPQGPWTHARTSCPGGQVLQLQRCRTSLGWHLCLGNFFMQSKRHSHWAASAPKQQQISKPISLRILPSVVYVTGTDRFRKVKCIPVSKQRWQSAAVKVPWGSFWASQLSCIPCSRRCRSFAFFFSRKMALMSRVAG